MSDGNDLLMSGGTPWAKWEKEGDSVTGIIKSAPKSRQSRDFDSGEPAWWDDECTQPKMEVTVELQTELRDPEIDFDDGSRLLVMGASTERLKAVRAAVKAAGAKGLAEGGEITVKWTSTDAPKKRGAEGLRHFSAKYVPPKADAADETEEAALNALAGLVG